jgi:hypothetical protein
MITNYNFDFADVKILGGYKNNVHVLGYRDTYDETDPTHSSLERKECILSIDRKMFQKMLNKWLDEKLDYCDRYDHYCGVFGYIMCKKITHSHNTVIYDYVEGLNIEKKLVVYNVGAFDKYIDMEHG